MMARHFSDTSTACTRSTTAASLSLKNTPRGLMMKCFAGCRPIEIRQAIAAILEAGATLPSPVAPELREVGINLLAIAMCRWQEGPPLPGSLAKQYLFERGIELEPETLRFHPALYHKESNTYGPAMIALVQDMNGTAVGVHRTWICPLTAESGGRLVPVL
jgi:hypothetical protein